MNLYLPDLTECMNNLHYPKNISYKIQCQIHFKFDLLDFPKWLSIVTCLYLPCPQVAWWEYAMEHLGKDDGLKAENFRDLQTCEITAKWTEVVGNHMVEFMRESAIVMEEDLPILK